MGRVRILALAAALVVAGVLAAVAAALNIADTNPPTGLVGVPYSFSFATDVGSGQPPIKWRVSSGAFPPGLTLSDEGSVSGTPSQPGAYTFYVEATDSGPSSSSTQEQRTIVIDTRLVVATNALPDAQINQPYAQQLTVSGGTANSWTVTAGNLPPGVALAANGALSGTPTAAGTFTFTVRATDGSKADTKQLTLFVLAPLELKTAAGTLPASIVFNGVVNEPFPAGVGVKASGGKEPYAYTSAAPLPAGLVLDGRTGAITGTPTAAANVTVTFRVTDALGGTRDLSARINVQPLLAFTAGKTLAAGKVGKRYSSKVPVTGRAKQKLFAASGNFPPGLSLNETTGVLSGRPLAAGAFKIKVNVFDDTNGRIAKTFTVRIAR